MHFARYLLSLFLLCQFPRLDAQTRWTMRDPQNPAFILTTETAGDTITGFTRKGALKDYVGEARFGLLKMVAGLKFSEIVHFNGKFQPADPVNFSGTYNYLFNENSFQGIVSQDSLIITLLDKNNKIVRVIRGSKAGAAPATDFKQAIENILSLTEKYIFNPAFLVSKDWENFRERLRANAPLIRDDMEMQVGFYAIVRDFPFSHYSLQVTEAESEKPKTTGGNFILSEPVPKTCLLTIRAFEGPRQAMDTVIDRIAAGEYTTLVIDLRDNRGGSNETALPLIAFISSQPLYGGFFPNSKWSEKFRRLPADSDYHYFSEFNSGTLEEFYRVAERGYGLYIKVIPSSKHFNGKVYVLTNQNTASTSEILALGLKENKLAVLAGRKTAGAALSGKRFPVDQRFSLMIPVNDYISPLGYRIDKRGIDPDIKIGSGDELDYLLKQIAGEAGK